MFVGGGAGEISVNLVTSCSPKPGLTMKGQDTQEPQLGCMVGCCKVLPASNC